MYDSFTIRPGLVCTCGCISEDFQSKDLGCSLSHYRITPKGFLYRGHWDPNIKKFVRWSKERITQQIQCYTWCPGCNRKMVGMSITFIDGKISGTKTYNWRLPS